MKLLRILIFVLLALIVVTKCCTQEYKIVPHNKIALTPTVNVKLLNNVFEYTFVLNNGVSAQQAVWRFDIIISVDSLKAVTVPANWEYFVFPVHSTLEWTAIPMDTVEGYIAPIKRGQTISGFSFSTPILPGIVTYYAEGDGPTPYFGEGQATDSPIPGYDDLTPYGPGVVGKTIGPVAVPDPFYPLDFIDTLSSYISQSHSLGWINSTRDDDAEEDENADDGIVKNLDKRLNKVKDLLSANKITRAKNQLEKFLTKVEKLWARYQKEIAKNKKNPVIIFTSEAYALLKYNGEYLMANMEAQPPPSPASKIQQKSDHKANIKR